MPSLHVFESSVPEVLCILKVLYLRVLATTTRFRNPHVKFLRRVSRKGRVLSRDSQIISRNAKVFVREGKDYISRDAKLNLEMISGSIPSASGTTVLPE